MFIVRLFIITDIIKYMYLKWVNQSLDTMTHLKLPCQLGGNCDFETVSLPYQQAKEQLDGHMGYAHGHAQAVSSNKPVKFPRPKIKLDSTAEQDIITLAATDSQTLWLMSSIKATIIIMLMHYT